jgi:hypothetical protein
MTSADSPSDDKTRSGGLRPEREGVDGLEIAAERLERRRRLQVDQNLLGVAVGKRR